VNENIGSILILRRRFKISSQDDIPGQETYLSSHVNELFIIVSHILSASKMLMTKTLIEGDNLSRVINSQNGSMLSLSRVITCGSNCDRFSRLPVYCFLKSDLSCSFLSSCFKLCPCWRPLDTMHVKSTKPYSNHLVSVDWNVWI